MTFLIKFIRIIEAIVMALGEELGCHYVGYIRFLKEARAAGTTCVNGAEMFIRQAMAQYRIFTGKEPDEQTFRRIVGEKLGK